MGPPRLMLSKNQLRVQNEGASLAFFVTNGLDRDNHLPDLDVAPNHPIERPLANDLIGSAWSVSRQMPQRAMLLQTARLSSTELLHLVDSNTELQDIQRHQGQGYPCARSGQARIVCRAAWEFLHNRHETRGYIEHERK